jgi:hypothetical protein
VTQDVILANIKIMCYNIAIMAEYKSSAYREADTRQTGHRRPRAAQYIKSLVQKMKLFSREAKPEAPLTPKNPEQVGEAFNLLVNRTLVDGSPEAKDMSTGHVRKGVVIAPNGDRYGMTVERTSYGATEIRVDPDHNNQANTTSMTYVGPNTAEPYARSHPTNPYHRVQNQRIGIMVPDDFDRLQRLLGITEWIDPNANAAQMSGAQHSSYTDTH